VAVAPAQILRRLAITSMKDPAVAILGVVQISGGPLRRRRRWKERGSGLVAVARVSPLESPEGATRGHSHYYRKHF
jgi:hypothetical protein